MRELTELTEYARYWLCLRWPVVLVLAGVVVSLPLLWPLTLPDVHRGMGVPPHRFVIVVSAAVASLLVLALRPLDALGERLAARNMSVARLALAATVVLAVVAAADLLLPTPSGALLHPVARNAAGLTGLGLALCALNVPLGLVAPWLLALSGVLFGYEPHPGGPATLRPWAWVLSENDSGRTAALVFLAVGLSVHTLRPTPLKGGQADQE